MLYTFVGSGVIITPLKNMGKEHVRLYAEHETSTRSMKGTVKLNWLRIVNRVHAWEIKGGGASNYMTKPDGRQDNDKSD